MSKNQVVFIDKHAQKYGLEVVARHPISKAVTGIKCAFCCKDRFEKLRGDTLTRKIKSTVMTWETGRFKSDFYKAHIESYHKEEFAKYQILSEAAKCSYFKANIPTASKLTSHFECSKDITSFYIRKDIIDILVNNCLLMDIESTEKRNKALSLLTKDISPANIGEGRKYDTYCIKIQESSQFKLSVSLYCINYH